MSGALDAGFGVLVPLRALEISTSRSSGPGGQNVNKVESRVTVRLDVAASPEVPEWVRPILLEKLASRLTKDGVLIVSSERHRDRGRNLAAACERMAEILREALTPRTPRRATRPTRASKSRHSAAKQRRSKAKRERRAPSDWDE